MTHNQRTQIRQAKYLSEGKCLDCREPNPGPNKRYCPQCAPKRLERRREVIAQAVSKGICRSCRKRPATVKFQCEICVLKKTSCRIFGTVKYWLDLYAIFFMQQGRCPYTDIPLNFTIAELDHIIPRSRRGPDSLTNLEWVYGPINSLKSSYTKDEFIRLLKLIKLK
jgi:5-methylcytosine-specific restriction endonuclease McrA